MERYMQLYQAHRINQGYPYIGESIGTDKDFIVGALVAFLLPLVGTVIGLCWKRTLKGRFGILFGTALVLLCFAGASIFFWSLSVLTGNPSLVIGAMLMQIGLVYFRRRLIDANCDM